MSLGKCPECGHVISTTAAFCVHCGGTAPAILPKDIRETGCDQCDGKNGGTDGRLCGGTGKMKIPSEG